MKLLGEISSHIAQLTPTQRTTFLQEVARSGTHNARALARLFLVCVPCSIAVVLFILQRVEYFPNYPILFALQAEIFLASLGFLWFSRRLGHAEVLSRKWPLYRAYAVFTAIFFNGLLWVFWNKLASNTPLIVSMFVYAILLHYPERYGYLFYVVNLAYYLMTIVGGAQQGVPQITAFFSGGLAILVAWLCERAILDLRLRDFMLRQTIEAQAIALQQANVELANLALRDGLTGLANRRAFDDFLQQAWERGAATQTPLSLLLCDVDHFKRYNDAYGHQAGDRCLQEIAAALRAAVRESIDMVARYGGEEFAAILPHASEAEACDVAARILAQVVNRHIPHQHSPTRDCVTLSIGVCSAIPQTDTSHKALILNADLALYAAKSQGRDRAVFQALLGESPALPADA